MINFYTNFQVKVEYVADFHPSTFISTDKLVHRYLLIPNVETLSPDPPFPDVPPQEWKHFMKSVQNMSEWMAIDKTFFDMSGFSCNKIGVSYSAFRRQPHACARKYGKWVNVALLVGKLSCCLLLKQLLV